MIPELLTGHAPSEVTAGFWAATARGELAIQRCTACSRFQHPPRAVCAACGGTDLAFASVSGRGTLYSHTVVERAFLPELRLVVPYAIGLVDLAEGPRLMAGLRIDPDALAIDLPVVATFEPVTAEVTLPFFVAA
jgi:uncharacterized OB-fold protein